MIDIALLGKRRRKPKRWFYATVCRKNRRTLVETVSHEHDQGGGLLFTRLSALLDDPSPASLGHAVLAALDQNRFGCVPDDESRRLDESALLSAMGASSRGEFERGLHRVSVVRDGTEYTLTRLQPRPGGGFVGMKTEEIVIADPDPYALGAAIEEALAERLDVRVEAITDPKATQSASETELASDLITAADWIAEALRSSGYEADFSLSSARAIEQFVRDQTDGHGRPFEDGLLGDDLGSRVFALGAYLGEVLVRNVGGEWITDDRDPEGEVNVAVRLWDGTEFWPVQRVINRLSEGETESLSAYVSVIARQVRR